MTMQWLPDTDAFWGTGVKDSLVTIVFFHYRVLLDPEWAEEHGWVKIDMRPGMALKSHHAHCVCGGGILSLAWNNVDPAHIKQAVEDQCAVAKHIREHPEEASAWRDCQRAFVLGSILSVAATTSGACVELQLSLIHI